LSVFVDKYSGTSINQFFQCRANKVPFLIT
jgi:hypothetical protein